MNIGQLAVADLNKISVKYYPNPVKDILTVSSDKKINSISIYSITGQLIKSNQNVNTIDMSKLPAGIYLIKTDVEGQTQMAKVIKK